MIQCRARRVNLIDRAQHFLRRPTKFVANDFDAVALEKPIKIRRRVEFLIAVIFDAQPVVHHERQLARRRFIFGVHQPRRVISRVGEELKPVLEPIGVEPLEILSTDKNLAAQFEVRRRAVDLLNQIADHRANVGGDVSTFLAVAATERPLKNSFAISQRRRHAVDFFLDQKICLGEFFYDLVDELDDVRRREHIVD